MFEALRRRVTFSNAAAVLALFIAIGTGGVYAAGKMKINGKQIQRGSIPGNRLVNHSVTGKQVKSSTLGTVPHADSANTATSANTANTAASANTALFATSASTASTAGRATSATNADHAGSADTAINANTASTAGRATSAANADHAGSADTATNASTVGGLQVKQFFIKGGANTGPNTVLNVDGIVVKAGCDSTYRPIGTVENDSGVAATLEFVRWTGAGTTTGESNSFSTTPQDLVGGSLAGNGQFTVARTDGTVISATFMFRASSNFNGELVCTVSGSVIAS